MKKEKTIFRFTDQKLLVYRWADEQLSIEACYSLHEPESESLFDETSQHWKDTFGYILLDLSSEEFHQEQLPHIHGKDRNRMLERKLNKLFPTSEYTSFKLLERQKTDRRDDLYLLAGVTEISTIEPYMDILVAQGIEICSVYSMPLLIPEIIKPLNREAQAIVIVAEQEVEGKLTYRQTFYDKDRPYFSRVSSTESDDSEQLAATINREIERTWQYLNSRRMLTQGGELQVLLIVPRAVGAALDISARAENCSYVFVRPAELVAHHGASDIAEQVNFTSLAAFMLGKKPRRKAHYKPEKLAFFRRHQQLNRYLFAASITAVVLSLAIFTNSFLTARSIDQSANQLGIRLASTGEQLQTLQDWFKDRDTSPEKMRSVVTAARNLAKPNPLPSQVFEVISAGYQHFDDLSITALEWKVVAVAWQGGLFNENDGGDLQSAVTSQQRVEASMDPEDDSGLDLSSPPNPTKKVQVMLAGEIDNFSGNYRLAIERIESFAKVLELHEAVAQVAIKKLPLDIHPSTDVNRSVAERAPPSFEIEFEIERDYL